MYVLTTGDVSSLDALHQTMNTYMTPPLYTQHKTKSHDCPHDPPQKIYIIIKIIIHQGNQQII